MLFQIPALIKNDELEKMWNKVIMAYFKALSQHLLGETEQCLENSHGIWFLGWNSNTASCRSLKLQHLLVVLNWGGIWFLRIISYLKLNVAINLLSLYYCLIWCFSKIYVRGSGIEIIYFLILLVPFAGKHDGTSDREHSAYWWVWHT